MHFRLFTWSELAYTTTPSIAQLLLLQILIAVESYSSLTRINIIKTHKNSFATMQLLILLSIILSLSVVNASFFPYAGGSQAIFADDLKVPGDNPFYHCSTPKNEMLDLSYVDLSPNPPEA